MGGIRNVFFVSHGCKIHIHRKLHQFHLRQHLNKKKSEFHAHVIFRWKLEEKPIEWTDPMFGNVLRRGSTGIAPTVLVVLSEL